MKSTVYMRKPKEMVQGKEQLTSSVSPRVKSLVSRNLDRKFYYFSAQKWQAGVGGRGGDVYMWSCLTLYRRILHLLIRHIFTLTVFSKIIQFEVGDAEIKHD